MAMRIYTKTGDKGTTALFAGGRVSKDHVRVAAYGDVDELNATLGLARCHSPPRAIDEVLRRVQSELFDLGAVLATPKQEKQRTVVSDAEITALEHDIDVAEHQLTPLTSFILPGGVLLAAALHHARTVCRRAERSVVTLMRAESETPAVCVKYLNRLSDLLFVLARLANRLEGLADVPWLPREKKR